MAATEISMDFRRNYDCMVMDKRSQTSGCRSMMRRWVVYAQLLSIIATWEKVQKCLSKNVTSEW